MKGQGSGASPNGKPLGDKKVDAAPSNDVLRERLATERVQYHKLTQQEKNGSFDASPDLEYFLLSTKFLKEWMEYTGYDDKDPSKGHTMIGATTQPQPLNADIINKDKGEVRLKPGLMEHSDYKIVSKAIMNVFKTYQGERLPKKAVRLANGHKIVEIYKLTFEYFIVDQKIIKSIAAEPTRKLVCRQAEISRYAKLPQMKNKCVEICKKADSINYNLPSQDVRIWKLEPDVSVDKFISHIKSTYGKGQISALSSGGLGIPSNGVCIHYKRDQTVAEFSIADDDVVVFEVKDFINGWVFSKDGAPSAINTDDKYSSSKNGSSYSKETSCEFCRQYRPIKVKCKCNMVEYCSEDCRDKDISYHSGRCRYASEVDVKQKIDMSWRESSRRGVTGLSNLGNTCFMNSCLQCLSNTIPLTEYFLTNKFQDEINVHNPIGTKGKLTVNYAKTIKGLWCEVSSTYSPYILKSSIGEFQPMFSGYQQHDSQELLSFLLDGLHEDLNRVLKKPATDTIESNGRSDQIVARESWTNFLKRNQSIIVDLFMGQYKSIVTCPTCNHESITFDPYSTLSLPIPQSPATEELKTQNFYMFYSNFRYPTKKVALEYNGKTTKDWRSHVAKEMRLEIDELKFFLLTFNDEVFEITDDTPVDLITKKLYSKDVDLFCLEITGDDLANSKKSPYSVFKFVNESTSKTFTFKRPFYLDRKATGLDIYRRIFAHVYKLAILKDRLSTHDNLSNPEKEFEKYFDKTKPAPFEIFVTDDKNPAKLLRFEDDYSKLPPCEFEVRVHNSDYEVLKTFNTYEPLKNTGYSYSYNTPDPYENKVFTLENCFEQFQRVEKLDEGNEWYCPKCKQHKLAAKQMYIYKTPKVLIIHLKRFKQKADKWFASKAKMGCLVKFPHELDVEKFVISKTLPEAYFHKSANTDPLVKPPKSFSADACTHYELFAVSNHYGSMGGGHYTAYAKNDGSWYHYNDSNVSKISPSQVINKDAYMLFYLRKDKKEAAL